MPPHPTLVRTHSPAESLKRDLTRTQEQASRQALLSGGRDLQFTAKSSQQRSRMADVTTRLESGNTRLEDAHRTLADTEDVAIGITSELQRNRETLLSTRGRVHETGGLLTSARRTINSMVRREFRTKVMLCCFALFLLIAIILTVYFAFIKTDDSSNNNNN